MSQIEDVEAIDHYMRSTPLKTPEAFQIKDAYIKWFDAAGFWDKNYSSDFYDEIRTRRNQLNIANATTETAKAQVRNVIETGVTTEEMQGKKKPAVDSQTGRVGSQIHKPSAPATPSTMPDANQVQGPVLVDPNKTYATIRQGSSGPDVKLWQTVIGVNPDGKFGPGTAAATKKWQSDHHLTPDGVVGKMSWAAAGTAPAPVFAPSAPQPIFAPSPTSTPAPTFAPATKPVSHASSKPVTVAQKPATQVPPKKKDVPQVVAKTKAQVKHAAIKTAGMLDVSGWPVWGKVVAGATLAASIGLAVMGKHGKHLFKY